jgi:hypothetical protein
MKLNQQQSFPKEKSPEVDEFTIEFYEAFKGRRKR